LYEGIREKARILPLMGDVHIYCISGLGADFRIFSKLRIKGAMLHPITWQIPEAGETLPAFARRLSQQIQHENPVLLGVSFGGMISTEISKILTVQKTIIVSSCKERKELPYYLRAAGKAKLHKAVPYWLVTQNKYLNRFIFDTRSREEELYLKRMMLADTNITFIKRSVDMILNWKNKECPPGIVHIHGAKDKLLLPSSVHPDYWIPDGGHFMIWNMADKVGDIIQSEIVKS
jgi:pimeloyl-ACP methyl ester carboxylesterase